ncbi:MAG: hypothetical protein NTW14_06195 [bacterium]|nr:hypothetical protein [bacterium]
MSHALRTTILLGAFWLLVFLTGIYFVHFRTKNVQEKLVKEEKVAVEELDLSENLVSGLPVIKAEVKSALYRWEHRDKVIPKISSYHETYNYLDQILKREPTTLNYDFAAQEESDSNGVHYSNYTLVGEAEFLDLYHFIWYVEHLPRYMRINSLDLTEAIKETETEDATQRWVKFTLALTALSADRPGFDAVQYAVDINMPHENYDPFAPARKEVHQIPPNVDGLPNVFDSKLRALTPNQVYLVDQNGELKILNLGDDVYLGRLVDILPDSNRAIFDLDLLFPPRRVSLDIGVKK